MFSANAGTVGSWPVGRTIDQKSDFAWQAIFASSAWETPRQRTFRLKLTGGTGGLSQENCKVQNEGVTDPDFAVLLRLVHP
jgi:hypothetical protein